VLTFWKVQLSKAIDHRQREHVFASVYTRPMDKSFGVIVHGFKDAVIDSKIEIGEDSLLMTSEHPGKLSEGFEATMGSPPVCVQRTSRPEPALQVLCRPGFALIVPKFQGQHIYFSDAIAVQVWFYIYVEVWAF